MMPPSGLVVPLDEPLVVVTLLLRVVEVLLFAVVAGAVVAVGTVVLSVVVTAF